MLFYALCLVISACFIFPIFSSLSCYTSSLKQSAHTFPFCSIYLFPIFNDSIIN
jgi:hypothetical protein